MSIRQATAAELRAVKEIVDKTVLAIYPRYYPKGAVEEFICYHDEEAISKDIADGKVYVYCENGVPVGTVSLRDDELGRLYVLPEVQGRGIGKALMDFAEERIFERYDAVWADASYPAKPLYLKRGYTEVSYDILETENGDFLCWDKMEKRRD